MTSMTLASGWEPLAIDTVGNVIEFWGFKRNQGRVWALLYLRGQALEAAEIQEALGLSKGAVSMVVRELERWGVIRRVRTPPVVAWKFVAETDLMRMIGRVLTERELAFVTRVRTDLEQAERAAKRANAPAEVKARLTRMRMLSQVVETAIDGFLRTSRLDLKRLIGVLKHPIQALGGTT